MSAYSSAVLALSPTAYYRCGDSLGSTIADSSGNGYDQTAFTAGGTIVSGGAGLVPADTTSLSIATTPNAGTYTGTQIGSAIPASGAWGIVAWIATSTSSQSATIAQWNGLGIGVGTDNLLQLVDIGARGTGAQLASGTTLPTDGMPHQVAIVYNNGAVSLMVDGTVLGTATWSIAQGSNYSSLFYAEGSYYCISASLGDVAFIPNLTVAQVANLYAIGSGGSSTVTGTGTSVQAPQESNGSGLGAQYVILNPPAAQSGSIDVSGSVTSGSITTGSVDATGTVTSSSVTTGSANISGSVVAAGPIIVSGAIDSYSLSTNTIAVAETLTTGGASAVAGAQITASGPIFAQASDAANGAFVPPVYAVDGSSLGTTTKIVTDTTEIAIPSGSPGEEVTVNLTIGFSGSSSYAVVATPEFNTVDGWVGAYVSINKVNGSNFSILIKSVTGTRSTEAGTVYVDWIAIGS